MRNCVIQPPHLLQRAPEAGEINTSWQPKDIDATVLPGFPEDLHSKYTNSSHIFYDTLPNMSPGIIEDHGDHEIPVRNKEATQQRYPEPLKLSGALDHFKHEDTTPVIGREFFDVNIVNDVLNAENADELLRDVAITSMYYS